MPAKPKQRLTPKQKRFVDEYLQDRNATAAAGRAGYNPDWGRHLYAKPHIREEIDRRTERIAEQADVAAADVIRELGRIAFSDIRKLYDEHGNLKPVNELDDDTAATLAGIEVEEQGVRKVKRYDKPKALELLGKYLGLFSDNPPMQPGTEVTEIKRTIVRAAPPKE